jgi:hypothetical protein
MATPGSNEGTAGGAAELQPLRQPLNRNNLVVDPPVNGPPRLAVASVLDEAMLLTNGAGVGSFDPGVGTRSFVGSVPWGRRNDLAIGARMGWILIIAIGSALGFGAILAALAALKTLL